VCGLYGLRPTHGAVPDADALHLAPSFDTAGWMTATAPLLRDVGSVLLPPGGRAASAGRLLSLGLRHDRFHRIGAALGLALWAGPAPIPGLEQIPVLQAAFRAAQAAEAWALRGAWIEASPGALGSDVEARFRFGASIDSEARQRAWAVINASKARFLDALSDKDAWLVLPASGGPGHRRDARPEVKEAWRQATLRVAVPASAFGLPSVSIPTSASPPEGIAIIGPPGSDHALLDAAVQVAASLHWAA
jgi:Asp-tRNA(Asn)/Glu-tRNA(Gln) amidotransferase A subunit family amidase